MIFRSSGWERQERDAPLPAFSQVATTAGYRLPRAESASRASGRLPVAALRLGPGMPAALVTPSPAGRVGPDSGRALDARAVDKVELQQGVSAHPRGQRSAGDTHPEERVVLLPAVEAAFGALKDR